MANLVLLKRVFPLIPSHGFTWGALNAGLDLSDAAIHTLWGSGRRPQLALINAWLDHARTSMGHEDQKMTVNRALHRRLDLNEPILPHLAPAFALLASPNYALPPLNPLPAIQHAGHIADEACFLAGDQSVQLSWYSRRTLLGSIYTAAELHQITSPNTAHAFLDGLLEAGSKIETGVTEAGLFTEYILKSWQGIIRSRGMF